MKQILTMSYHNYNRNFSYIFLFLTAIFSILFLSCSTPQRGLFAKRTPHEQYAERITNAGLKETTLGSLWFNAALKGINQPVLINLPYKETGYFAAEKPNAAGYRFTARKGEKLIVTLAKKPVSGFALFVDLWHSIDNAPPKFLASLDTLNNAINYEVDQEGFYQLRIQPELLKSGEYTLTILTGPSLAFPVPSSSNPRIGSFWGANRDAGSRKHEGIDIFGTFRTPVVAAADGYITGVNENRLGGKVVWLRPHNKNYTLYYAHLDSQIARQGEQVKAGDVIGLMGNTGNAKFTPTHLHFGIYTMGGPVDPLPFVNIKRAAPANISTSTAVLNENMRNSKATSVYAAPTTTATKIASLESNSLLSIQAATASFYKVSLADGREGFVSSSTVSPIKQPLRKLSLLTDEALLDAPDSSAPAKAYLNKGEKVDVLASTGNYYFVQDEKGVGWIPK
jgi:murein DD-endopeptidase MepM/ murein hydrolase activator NlpD